MTWLVLVVVVTACVGTTLGQDGDDRQAVLPVSAQLAPSRALPPGFPTTQGSVPILPFPPRCNSGFGSPEGFMVKKARSGLEAGKVRFSNVDLSFGGWSQRFSDYQAPCNGYYYFSFHGVSEEFSLKLSLVKVSGSRTKVVSAWTAQGFVDRGPQVPAGGGFVDLYHAANSALVYLRRGDLVHLELEEGHLYEVQNSDDSYTTLSAFMIHGF